MHTINITVRDKIAVNPLKDRYVCGNSDYVVHFDLDAEWDAYENKTARFIAENGEIVDQPFAGTDCPVPVFEDTYQLMVGVFAGNLCTTTAAYIPARKSIRSASGAPAAPRENVYDRIMAQLNALAPAATDPHTHLVTDPAGNPVWEPRFAWKTVTTEKGYVYVYQDAELAKDDGLFLLTPPASSPVAGETYTLIIGSNEYTSYCVDSSALTDGLESYVFGNTAAMGDDLPIENPDPDAEYFVLLMPGGSDGIYGLVLIGEEPAPLIITIRSAEKVETTTTDIKTLDPELLPPEALRKKITLTIADDGTVTSDTDFDTAWAMDAAELQAAINIVSDVFYFGHVAGECTPLHVLKVENTFGDTTVKGIQMRYVTPFTDISDTSYRSEASFLFWVSTDGEVSIGKETPRCPGLPLSNALTAGMYMRYNGSHWDGVTLDQLKADLGLA